MNSAQDTARLLLELGLESLDIPPLVDQAISGAYHDLAAWIERDSRDIYRSDASIYPQGSRRIETLVQPVDPNDDIDVDLVYCRDISRASVSQAELKRQVGEQLARYVTAASIRGAATPHLIEGRRCWTLRYQRFHLDILPALPDEESEEARGVKQHAIVITDRELTRWQHSNPKGYAAWFMRNSERSAAAKAAAVRIDGKVDVEPLRAGGENKSVLQRCVQLLKRHRDMHYAGNPDDCPISIIITTLATYAYDGESDLYAALSGIARRMVERIELRNGVWWVQNPVDARENFADKWQQYPARRVVFLNWVNELQIALLGAARLDHGLDQALDVIKTGWGQRFGDLAGLRYGEVLSEQARSGQLRAQAGRAALGTVGAVIPPHHFYGRRGR